MLNDFGSGEKLKCCKGALRKKHTGYTIVEIGYIFHTFRPRVSDRSSVWVW